MGHRLPTDRWLHSYVFRNSEEPSVYQYRSNLLSIVEFHNIVNTVRLLEHYIITTVNPSSNFSAVIISMVELYGILGVFLWLSRSPKSIPPNYMFQLQHLFFRVILFYLHMILCLKSKLIHDYECLNH